MRICAACGLISREHAIYEHNTNLPLQAATCRQCGANLTQPSYQQTSQPREKRLSLEQQQLQTVITHLYDTLDARRAGTETDLTVPPEVRNAARSGMTHLREDAASGWLNPALSIELASTRKKDGTSQNSRCDSE